MRQFTSYGPVDSRRHFSVPRSDLLEQCVDALIGKQDGEGHFFTIYAPRQAGKTWLMRRAVEEIRIRCNDRFRIGTMSMQGVRIRVPDEEEGLLSSLPRLLTLAFGLQIETLTNFDAFLDLFRKDLSYFDRPVILLIDEFDKLPPDAIDALVGAFRDLYLDRERYWLHGLALIGVHAVLGVDSPRGSPFNIQRSLQVPNFTREEVQELFRQYQEESGQAVDPAVVAALFDAVRGQPGLTCWFGELLTQKYNTDPASPIDMGRWRSVYARGLFTEFNNNLSNLEAKARRPFSKEVQTLFVRSDVPFSVSKDWCAHLFLHGIITPETAEDVPNATTFFCRFASPFVQRRLYEAFSSQLQEALSDVPVLDGADTLEDVYTSERFNVAALLKRYKAYLEELRARGRDPFLDQALRADFQIPEAVGHFHIYAWLLQAIGKTCLITPEFPTGNGKVDLRIQYGERVALLEVKSLQAAWALPLARAQAARYARQLGLQEATLAAFASTKHPEKIAELEGTTKVEGIWVHVVTIGWRA